VLELGPSWRLLVEVLVRKEPYPYHILRYRRFGVKVLQLTNSRDRESQKELALRTGLWSCGGEDSHLVHVVQVGFS